MCEESSAVPDGSDIQRFLLSFEDREWQLVSISEFPAVFLTNYCSFQTHLHFQWSAECAAQTDFLHDLTSSLQTAPAQIHSMDRGKCLAVHQPHFCGLCSCLDVKQRYDICCSCAASTAVAAQTRLLA